MKYDITPVVALHLGMAKRAVELTAKEWGVPFNEALVQVENYIKQAPFTPETLTKDELRGLLTPSNLALVTTLVRAVGWGADFIETRNMLEHLYEIAGVELPDDLEPYEVQ